MLFTIKFLYTSFAFFSGTALSYFFIKPLKSLTISSILSPQFNSNKEILSSGQVLHEAIKANINNLQNNDFNFIKDILLSNNSKDVLYFIIFISFFTFGFNFIQKTIMDIKAYLFSVFNPFDFFNKKGYYKPQDQIDLLLQKISDVSDQLESLTRAVKHNQESIAELSSISTKSNKESIHAIKSTLEKQINISFESTTKLVEKSIKHNSQLLDLCNSNINKNSARLKDLYNYNRSISSELSLISNLLKNSISEGLFTEQSLNINEFEIVSKNLQFEPDIISENKSLNLENKLGDASNKLHEGIQEYYNDLENSFLSKSCNCSLLSHSPVMNSVDNFRFKFGVCNPTYTINTRYQDASYFSFINSPRLYANNLQKNNTNVELLAELQQLSIGSKFAIILSSFAHIGLDRGLDYSNSINNKYTLDYLLKYMY